MKRLITASTLAAAMLLCAGTRAGAETPLDKYEALLQEKRAQVRENELLQREAEFAATKSPYILFYLKEGKLEFRVRGRAFKSYTFSPITLDERGRRPADPEAVWKAIGKSLTVIEVQGAHPELIPQDPNTPENAGELYADPNQLASQTGVAAVRSDAGLLGVDVPTDYYVKFAEDVVFHIRTPKTYTFREKAADRLSDVAESMRATLSGLWSRKEIEVAARPRLELYMTTDADTAKYLHYSLLPGEKILGVPPPPPPILLVASSSKAANASGGKARPAAR